MLSKHGEKMNILKMTAYYVMFMNCLIVHLAYLSVILGLRVDCEVFTRDAGW